MTKDEIIKTIVVALIGTFSKSLFDSLLGKYMPDKKKLNSYIIKFLVLSLRYGLPIYFLIKAFLSSGEIDKNFVFQVSIFTAVLFFNLLIDIIHYYTMKQLKQFDRLLTVVEKSVDHIERLHNAIELTAEKIESKVVDQNAS